MFRKKKTRILKELDGVVSEMGDLGKYDSFISSLENLQKSITGLPSLCREAILTKIAGLKRLLNVALQSAADTLVPEKYEAALDSLQRNSRFAG